MARVKRIFFFKDRFCFGYDPRPEVDRLTAPSTAIRKRFFGLLAPFQDGIDAAVNWGDGFVYFFKDDTYWKYDVFLDEAIGTEPRKIKDGWPGFPEEFAAGIDAAFNSGTGKAYFFKGAHYLRYHIKEDRVDDPDPGTAPYPRAIADPDGWHGLDADFSAGIDAAANAGEDILYFFKRGKYVRLSYAARSVVAADPPYPRDIFTQWPGLPPQVDAAVEWLQAGTASLAIEPDPGGCIGGDSILSHIVSRRFTMTARFGTQGYPTHCGCAEYRQFVRGSMTLGGSPVEPLLTNPDGSGKRKLLPRPVNAQDPDNFQEDSGRNGSFYGHRNAGADPVGVYDNPDQRAGCHYAANDTPHLAGSRAADLELDLDFRGVIIDVCADNEELVRQHWTIRCIKRK